MSQKKSYHTIKIPSDFEGIKLPPDLASLDTETLEVNLDELIKLKDAAMKRASNLGFKKGQRPISLAKYQNLDLKHRSELYNALIMKKVISEANRPNNSCIYAMAHARSVQTALDRTLSNLANNQDNKVLRVFLEKDLEKIKAEIVEYQEKLTNYNKLVEVKINLIKKF